jgi:hypothetical protein
MVVAGGVLMEETMTESHPFRTFLKFLFVIGVVAAVARVVASKKDEYYGLTESEARAKFESKLGPRIGEEKASEVADQVIPRLKDTGFIKADPMEQAMADAKDMASGAADKVKDTAGKAGDAMKDAADSAADAVKDAVKTVKDKTD